MAEFVDVFVDDNFQERSNTKQANNSLKQAWFQMLALPQPLF